VRGAHGPVTGCLDRPTTTKVLIPFSSHVSVLNGLSLLSVRIVVAVHERVMCVCVMCAQARHLRRGWALNDECLCSVLRCVVSSEESESCAGLDSVGAHGGMSSVESGVGAGGGLSGCSRRGEWDESGVGAVGLSGCSRRDELC